MNYYNLGTYSRPVSTSSAKAQLWFDRGLNWTYGFNHEEAIRCFERALAADPNCAMAWWGLAYAYGPYINKEWRFYAHDELVDCLPQMRAAVVQAETYATDPVELGLAKALSHRYQSDEPMPVEVMDRWNDAFAEEMVAMYQAFPEDPDVIAIAVEALMMRTPWKLWDQQSGEQAPGASSHQMLEILERGMTLSEASIVGPHPGICHMVIHTVEMSSRPELGEEAADALRDLVPDCGHLQHMPTHIDVLCGDFEAAVIASEKAIAADKLYLKRVGPFGQYTAACCHDYHLMMFASMFMGRFSSAIDAAMGIEELVSRDVLLAATPAFQITLEAYYSMSTHVLLRFGRWDDLLTKPLPHDQVLYPAT
ncbi:MAG: tetratricopeptide repeat protein, partial [Chloroflexota bacterium]